MRFVLTFGLVAAIAASTSWARAESCRPPAPGSWSDPELESAFDAALALLDQARPLTGDARRRLAKRAEETFRDIERLHPCLPSNVVALARALELQQQYVRAAEQYQRIVDARPELTRGGRKFWKSELEAAEAGAAAALGKTALMTLHLGSHACATSLPRAYMDEAPVSFGSALRLDPGPHRVRVEALDCAPFEQQALTTEGGDEQLEVVLQARSVDARPVRSCKLLGLPCWATYSAGAALALGLGVGAYAAFKPSAEPAPTNHCSGVPPANFGCLVLQ